MTLLSSFIWKQKALPSYMEAGTTLHCVFFTQFCVLNKMLQKRVWCYLITCSFSKAA